MIFILYIIKVTNMKVMISNNKLSVPTTVTIPYIVGDGIGPDIMSASMKVWNFAIEKAYKDERAIDWLEIFAGEKALKQTGEILPKETLSKIKEYVVALKGPLTTPIGGGFRSLNIAIRQELDLYANIRPIRYFKGVPSPMCSPELVDATIFRENTEDLYMGIEWAYNSLQSKEIREFLKSRYNVNIREDSGIGIKPISEFGTKRIARKAFDFAVKNSKRKVTIMHKGNIMKYTEGAFREWCYQVAKEEYPGKFTREDEPGSVSADKRIILNDRIADSMFQQMLTCPSKYEVIITPNLNGDYLSDAVVAQVGGLGFAPSVNIGDFAALYEPVHGSAPKYANKNIANPTSLILSGKMMFEYLGWTEVAGIIERAIEKTISNRQFTNDIARVVGISALKTSEYAQAIVNNMQLI